MSDRKRTLGAMQALSVVGLALALAVAASASAMSIEPEPVKVTHHNSGPRYDIGAVERTRMSPSSSSGDEQPSSPAARPLLLGGAPDADQNPKPAGPGGSESDNEDVPIQRVALRRIFLFPIARPSSDWSESATSEAAAGGESSERVRPERVSGSQREQEGEEHEPMPSMFAKPFWPFMTPARVAQPARDNGEPHTMTPHRHLFGADEASRSPPASDKDTRDMDKQASGGEREPQQLPAGLIDPIEMMMKLMHEAIASQLQPSDLSAGPNKPTTTTTTSGQKDNDNESAASAESSDERPQVPQSLFPFLGGRNPITSLAAQPKANESREDVVEIDGKKYLRKTVISRHVGENLIFVTRRLIFVPLNETDPETGAGAGSGTTETVATTTTTTTTTTEQPTTTTAAAAAAAETEPVLVDRVGVNKPAATEPAATTTTTTEQPASTSAEPVTAAAATTTTERASSASPLPERVVETTPASKPAEVSSEPAKPAES